MAAVVEEEGGSVFGRMLRSERARRAIPEARFAEEAGLSVRLLDEIESGRITPDPRLRQLLNDALERLIAAHRASDFGAVLKQERHQRRLTVAGLSRRSGVSGSVIIDIERGLHLADDRMKRRLLAALRDNRHPDLPAQEQIVRESGGTVRRPAQVADRDRYVLGNTVAGDRNAGRGLTGGRMGAPVVSQAGKPDPLLITSAVDFVEMLGAVHVWAGAPAMRRLETDSGGVLKRSTISDALNVERVRKLGKIPSLEWVLAFLQVCGIRGTEDWVFAWRRLKAQENQHTAKWLPGRQDAGLA
ncbi:helix-turn-helix transcriptional regulator [Streptomyces lavendulae]|uniref:helix-turn-helix domain-containing protein n=1 Tax=Streptomyces lavendulae TaxID=1914 RepID=UPI00331D0017